jgi:hypothetical protein
MLPGEGISLSHKEKKMKVVREGNGSITIGFVIGVACVFIAYAALF